ncbi:hypothetical protein AAVH_02471 [Aphelenchoides avenae]|nr:hypothetical protein AAVH_02471 [Aphelenchus avenae]
MRRQTTLAINVARRHGTPLEAEQMSMSRKQAKRAYNEVLSIADGKTGKSRTSKKGPPLEDVTNSAAVRTETSTRRKRAATKQLDVDWSDSAPDGGSSSSSDFEPDADHVSEDEVDAGEHEDLDADDLDIGVTPSDSGEPSGRSEARKGIADRYKHPVWTFFTIDEETLAPTCRTCLVQFASPPDSGRARKHLRTRHAELYEELEGLIAESGYAKKIGLDELQAHTTNIAQYW